MSEGGGSGEALSCVLWRQAGQGHRVAQLKAYVRVSRGDPDGAGGLGLLGAWV